MAAHKQDSHRRDRENFISEYSYCSLPEWYFDSPGKIELIFERHEPQSVTNEHPEILLIKRKVRLLEIGDHSVRANTGQSEQYVRSSRY